MAMVAKKQARKPRPRRPVEKIKKDNKARVRRMDAWMVRARAFHWNDKQEEASSSPDAENALAIGVHAQFIFWWIAFEAGYAREGKAGEASGSRNNMGEFIDRVMRKEVVQQFWPSILQRVEAHAIAVIELPPASQQFWREGRKSPNTQWEDDFRRETENAKKELTKAIAGDLESVRKFLRMLCIKRLYVVRNQIFHGGSSLDNSYGYPQVELGVKLLSELVYKFRQTIFHNPSVDWGPVPYPRQEPVDKWQRKISQ